MERVDANLVPFAQNNLSGYRFAFGTDTATDDINANYNDNIKKGWGATPNEFPEVEDFNAMVYTIGYLLSYLYHMGIAEWNDKQKYRQYSRVIGSDGIIYKAKTGTDISPNINNNPTTDTTNWEIDNQFNINSLENETTPIDTDNFGIQETSGLLKRLSWANLKATLKTYFDTLYVKLTPTIASGTATFTNATNNINLTGIGIGVEVGDVIQITGSTNNNGEFTIEVITDNNNIIVNQAHAGKSRTVSPIGLKSLINETATVTVKLLAKYYNASNGLGQDWVDVTENRTVNISYPNITNREIFVAYTSTQIGSGSSTIEINGKIALAAQQSSVVGAVNLTLPISKRNNYLVNGSNTKLYWREKR